MYRTHVPILAAAMRADPKIFVRACMFAIISARTKFIRVPDQIAELDRDGPQAICLWGWKIAAYDYLAEHGEEIWRSTLAAADTGAAMGILCRVPGLGIVKGAFVLQMLGHDCACLDARNISREDRNPRAYRSDGAAGKNTKSFARKIDRYIADVGGKAQFYWDAWCHDVAKAYGHTAAEISAMHVDCIVPKRWRLTSQPKERLIPAGDIPF